MIPTCRKLSGSELDVRKDGPLEIPTRRKLPGSELDVRRDGPLEIPTRRKLPGSELDPSSAGETGGEEIPTRWEMPGSEIATPVWVHEDAREVREVHNNVDVFGIRTSTAVQCLS